MDIRANILVDTIALFTASAVLLGEIHQKKENSTYQKRFLRLLIINVLILLMDMLAWLFDGHADARLLCIMTNTGYYFMQITYAWLWTVFVYGWSKNFSASTPVKRLILVLPLLCEAGILIGNFFTHRIFLMDETDHYRRGADYAVNLIPYILYIAASFFILIRALLTDTAGKRHGLVLMLGMLLPTCGSVIESRSFGLTFTWPLATLSLLLIFLSQQQEQLALDKAKAESSKAELIETQMSIMLSQIQPHFLYNSLSVISELCESNPATARYATLQFSAFLRGNMSSLTMNRPIPFEHELQHTKNYLALEQLRFPDRLHIEFQIETMLFSLPTLTLQPIVENAVRYGVTKRPEGGTVIIGTKETENSFVLTVTDDGVGFDPLQTKEDNRAHIGISNVRSRLERMVNGTLDVTGTPGEGTVAVITIPKGAFPC